MNNTNNDDERISKITFASVYQHYLPKVENKGRTKEELHQVIEWLATFMSLTGALMIANLMKDGDYVWIDANNLWISF